jgi:hypothetical protein
MDIFMGIKGDYLPGTIHADVVLVRATMDGEGVDTPAHHFVKDPVFGWGGHTTGTMEIIDAAGGHVSMLLDEPWCTELAQRLGHVLLGHTRASVSERKAPSGALNTAPPSGGGGLE